MIYTDAYLYDLASEMLDKGRSTLDVVEHLIATTQTTRENATRIVSAAFDPSRS